MLRSKNSLVALTCVLSISATPAVDAALSTFDAGREGWSVVDLIQPFNGLPTVASVLTPVFTATGGNPGGAIQQSDPSGNAWFFSAPSAFLGDKSASLSGNISWDLALDRPAGGGGNSFEQLIITDGVTALYYLDTGPDTANTWRTYEVSLVGSSFHVGSSSGLLSTDAELETVLSNLNGLYILGDWTNGIEVGSLDNVAMSPVPLPGAAWLLASSLIGIAGVQNRRKQKVA